MVDRRRSNSSRRMERVGFEEEKARILRSWEKVPMKAMNEDGSVKEDYFDQVLPPGFRFEPSDKDLATLLWKKINNENMPFHKIREANVYACAPQELTREHVLKREHQWYCFSPRSRKYPNGSRPNRAAGNGFWRPNESEKPIGTIRDQACYKTSLDYFVRIPKKSKKTDWKMHEFVFKDVVPPQQNKRTRDGDMKLNDWVLCRIYKSKRSDSSDNSATEANPLAGSSIGGQNDADIQAPCPTSNQLIHNIANHMNVPSVPLLAESEMCYGGSGSSTSAIFFQKNYYQNPDYAYKDSTFFQDFSQPFNQAPTDLISLGNDATYANKDPVFLQDFLQASNLSEQQGQQNDSSFVNIACQNDPDLTTTSVSDSTSMNATSRNGLDSMTTSNIFDDKGNLLSEIDDNLALNMEDTTQILDGCDQGINHQPRDDETLVPWKAPDNGWIKLNLNVCNHINGGQVQAECSGVFRDSQGQWLLGYILNLSSGLSPSPGSSPTELADLWILLTGLQLAWNKGWRNLSVESESVALMELLRNGCAPNHHGSMPVNGVMEMMGRKEWQVRLELISETSNKVAQSLVGHGLQMSQGVTVLIEPPSDCLAALALDMMSLMSF